MKKIIYIGLVLFYAFIGAIGLHGNAYTESDGTGRMMGENVVLLIFVSIVLGTSAWYFFPKIFPLEYTKLKKSGRIFVPIIFIGLSFVFTTGLLLFSNASFGNQQRIGIDGFIESKWSSGRRSKEYFVGIRDSASGSYYEFLVKKNIYEQVGNKGDKISKLFYKGSLGVIYRPGY